MKGLVANDIEELVEGNRDLRRVVYTGKNLRLVLMSLRPGEDIGEEVHETHDPFFRVEQGKGEVRIDDGVVCATKADAAAIEEHFDGKTAE